MAATGSQVIVDLQTNWGLRSVRKCPCFFLYKVSPCQLLYKWSLKWCPVFFGLINRSLGLERYIYRVFSPYLFLDPGAHLVVVSFLYLTIMTEFDSPIVLFLSRKCFGLDLISFRRDLKADTFQCSPLFNSAKLTIRRLDLNTSGKKTSFVFSSVWSQINSNQLLWTKQMAQRTRFLDVPDKHIDHSWSEFSRWAGEFLAPPKTVWSRMFDAL